METALYLPVKSFLEKAGLIVKGEISGCDLVGLSDDAPPVVVVCELKLAFNLELILQAVDRAAVSDEVWIAARMSRRKGRENDKRYRDLCRRLGIGMLGVWESGEVSVLVSAVSPMPRTNTKRRSRLVSEHRKRKGDPVVGGSTRMPMMTARLVELRLFVGRRMRTRQNALMLLCRHFDTNHLSYPKKNTRDRLGARKLIQLISQIP